LSVVGCVGDVHDERGGASDVTRVAAEEGWAGVEAEVDEGVLVGNGGEGGAVLDSVVQRAFVGCDERGTIRPVVDVGGRIDGEDHIDFTLRLDERVQGDVLSVLATIGESQLLRD